MNYFAYPTAAERYAKGRPFFHPLAMEKIAAVCCQGTRIKRALDVGCGTGQSSIALLEVADEVVGMDNSTGMLSHAICHKQVRYVEARAEQMPFLNTNFDLITVALAFHWFDRRPFLTESRRILRPGGWLVIYNDAFSGRMAGNDEYETWNRDHYLARYPTPPRSASLVTDSEALEHRFAPLDADDFVHEVKFTSDQLVSYLLTQTNVIAAVEGGKENAQSVANWLRNSIAPLFVNPTETFSFFCEMRFLKAI